MFACCGTAGADAGEAIETEGKTAVLTAARSQLAGWPPLLARSWVSSSSAADGEVAKETVKVMSFNILADSKQGSESWEATPPEALLWEQRKWRLLEEILVSEADIVCLQEADHFEDFFQPQLRRVGFAGIIQKEPDPAADGCAIFFKEDRFAVQGVDLDLEFAAIAMLEDRRVLQSGKPSKIVASSIHLASGKDKASEEERQSQALLLLTQLQRISTDWRPSLTLICADLNATPAPFDKVQEPLAYPALMQSALKFQSAYMGEDAMEPPYTTWKKRKKGEIKRTIDFIFYAGSVQLLRRYELPKEEQVPPERTPAFEYPSDHFSLAAEFCIQAS
mmetsp:Transcript_12094/g.22193  ORF Transcript_12094/g.22193 Transcript_12094/m.22193 type:complete len:335 (+) Transcript_12094:43-1047(+)